MTLTAPGNTAALWLGALWNAAPVLTSRSEAMPRDSAFRIRDAIVPGATGDLAGSALPAAAAVCVSWPQIARPLMQGDSIAYHLPALGFST